MNKIHPNLVYIISGAFNWDPNLHKDCDIVDVFTAAMSTTKTYKGGPRKNKALGMRVYLCRKKSE